MKTALTFASLALASLSGAAVAQTTLFEQLPILDNIISSDSSGSDENQRIADDFVFGDAVDVTSIQWWGAYTPLGTDSAGLALDDFSITIFSNGTNATGDVPDQIVFQSSVSVTAVDTGDDILGLVDQFLYTATLATPLTLNGNERYWLQVLNNTGLGAGDPPGSWGWEVAGEEPNGFFATRSGDGNWSRATAGTAALAFRINGSVVPTPGAAAVFGAAGLVAFRRRR